MRKLLYDQHDHKDHIQQMFVSEPNKIFSSEPEFEGKDTTRCCGMSHPRFNSKQFQGEPQFVPIPTWRMASVARAWTFASIAVAICHWRSLSLDQVQNLSEKMCIFTASPIPATSSWQLTSTNTSSQQGTYLQWLHTIGQSFKTCKQRCSADIIGRTKLPQITQF